MAAKFQTLFVLVLFFFGAACARVCTKKQNIQYKDDVLKSISIGGSNFRPADPNAYCQEECSDVPECVKWSLSVFNRQGGKGTCTLHGKGAKKYTKKSEGAWYYFAGECK